MTRHLVVARFNEDIKWLNGITSVDKIFLYNKGEKTDFESVELPNINREAHTYIYHIVNNYEDLADLTFFCQGNPFDHMPDSITPVNISEKIYEFDVTSAGKVPFYTKGMSGCDDGVTTALYRELFEGSVSSTAFSPGAQWVVSRDNIKSKTLDFYTKIWENLQIDRRSWNDTLYNGWSFESMWCYIF